MYSWTALLNIPLLMPIPLGLQNLFGDEVFGKMKKGARIVNVARGGVIDDAALARALDAGQVAGVRSHAASISGVCDLQLCAPYSQRGARSVTRDCRGPHPERRVATVAPLLSQHRRSIMA